MLGSHVRCISFPRSHCEFCYRGKVKLETSCICVLPFYMPTGYKKDILKRCTVMLSQYQIKNILSNG